MSPHGGPPAGRRRAAGRGASGPSQPAGPPILIKLCVYIYIYIYIYMLLLLLLLLIKAKL